MPAALLVRPPVNAVGSLLFLGASSKIDGIAVTFARSSSKQVGRVTTGTFEFKLVKGGKKVEVQLETTQSLFQAEAVAHGALFVFEQRSEDIFTVMLAAAAAPAQLDEQACLGLIDQAAKRAGIKETGASGLVSELGILRVPRDSWTAYCGRYTKRVWFSPRGEAGAGATP
ncbi:MAG: hypothetical protein H0T42_09130 [Deltaproteobacteria bacterium]|nr:hypothetical protein [Deltaproteobacteria bacterium]